MLRELAVRSRIEKTIYLGSKQT